MFNAERRIVGLPDRKITPGAVKCCGGKGRGYAFWQSMVACLGYNRLISRIALNLKATCLTLVTRVVVRCLLFVDRCCNLLAAKRMAAQRNRQPTTDNRQLATDNRQPTTGQP